MKPMMLACMAATLAWSATIQLTAADSLNKALGVNVVLNVAVNNAVLNDLSRFGKVRDVVYEINALTLQTTEGALPDIRSLPYVVAANPDAERHGSPIDTVSATDFSDGMSTWDLDAINVTDNSDGTRQVEYDGAGVYVAVLDSGLLDSWRQYFPQERIAEEYARCFGGGGGEEGNVSEQPNKWEHDQNSHGTHVTSTILGYRIWGPALGWRQVNGVAPMATVIPVKVINQNNFGWASVVARAIVYVANLKAGPLADQPVVINMSLGGPIAELAMEAAAIDYAISKGVIIVASAGNEGTAGMGYPAAYAPVISVAASGWTGQWYAPSGATWWWSLDVTEPTNPDDFYIANFSSREKPDQDLDVAAPGVWTVGPYQVNSGHWDYYFLAGTSMAAPHVTGIVALMAQKHPALTAPEAEAILEGSAIPLAPGSRAVRVPSGVTLVHSWDADATGAGLATADAALAATP